MEVLAVSHVHSEWSYDAKWTLADLGASFGGRGCRVVMMTEHDRGFSEARWRDYRAACAAASSSEMLVVPGMEYSDADNRVHVLTWGLSAFLGERLPTLEMLRRVREANGIAVLAHPARKSAWQAFAPEWEELLAGIELWNRKYDGWAPSETSPALLERTGVTPFVGLDFHTDKQFFPLCMALEIDGPVSEESVLGCLRAGRCSPRAFGSPLKESFPLLRMAEKSRRVAARLARKTGVLSR